MNSLLVYYVDQIKFDQKLQLLIRLVMCFMCCRPNLIRPKATICQKLCCLITICVRKIVFVLSRKSNNFCLRLVACFTMLSIKSDSTKSDSFLLRLVMFYVPLTVELSLFFLWDFSQPTLAICVGKIWCFVCFWGTFNVELS